MSEKSNCVYITPCGWCSKWDKECDEQMYTSAYRRKHPKPIKVVDDVFDSVVANKRCKSEEDHEWECCGISTAGTDYVCKKCYSHKTIPVDFQPISVTI